MNARFFLRNRHIFVIDLGLILLSVLLSWLLRVEATQIYYIYLEAVGYMLVLALLIKPLIYHWFLNKART